MRTIHFGVLAIVISASALAQDTPPRAPTSVGMTIVTVYSDGESIQRLKSVPDTTKEPVVQTFTVSIPYTENGVTKTRTETRTRSGLPTVKKLLPLEDHEFFMSIKGEQLDPAVLASTITQAGKPVLQFYDAPTKEQLELIRKVVREDTVIFISPMERR